ncbi:hypothetical protein M409DRAFT_49625 [Zasmidium cellare ATCC 36951]|uniref:Uncharacterized protein n=1 Tax=Zasmidium cellare ATCC 36951 TaxID=1080233 RepID=A0A6A6D1A1_ZASCE|nr:uncharacterized protein M409DRAFT_49625 [Zasmidium cellare ATCC 36951]KAF2173141.1 hypothetical protein M409DRAFT_49625 [Zasmidium cellare ATCC 36951]
MDALPMPWGSREASGQNEDDGVRWTRRRRRRRRRMWSTWNIGTCLARLGGDPPEGLRFPHASPSSSTSNSASIARDTSRLHTRDEELKQSGSINLVEVQQSHVQRTAKHVLYSPKQHAFEEHTGGFVAMDCLYFHEKDEILTTSGEVVTKHHHGKTNNASTAST